MVALNDLQNRPHAYYAGTHYFQCKLEKKGIQLKPGELEALQKHFPYLHNWEEANVTEVAAKTGLDKDTAENIVRASPPLSRPPPAACDES